MRSLFVLLAFAAALCVQTASAQTALPGGVLTEEERTIIRDYFGKKMGEVLSRRDTAAKTAEDKEDDGGSGKKKHAKSKGKSHAKGKGHGKGLPPGLAKRSTLPPGLQRQLDEKGALPPGLQARDLPADLEEKLPPVKDEFKRVIVDNSVVLIDKATKRVLDVLDGVVNGAGKKK